VSGLVVVVVIGFLVGLAQGAPGASAAAAGMGTALAAVCPAIVIGVPLVMNSAYPIPGRFRTLSSVQNRLG
jgi:hypothetical protein